MSESVQHTEEPVQAISVPAKEVTAKLIRTYADYGDQPAGETPGVGLSPSAILHALRRTWMLGAILGIVCSIPLALLAWMFIQPKFEATALIRVSPQHVPLLFETADHTGRADFKTYKNTQRQLLYSPQLLNSALKKPAIEDLAVLRGQADPVAWLQSKLQVTFPDDAEIMQVALTLTDGRAAQKIVDTVVATYYEDVVVAEQNERLRRIDNLERAKADAEGKARTRRADLRGLVETLGTSDTSTLNLAQQAAVQQYSLLRTELTKVQFDLMRAEGELKYQSRSEDERSEASAEGQTSSQTETEGKNVSGDTGKFVDGKLRIPNGEALAAVSQLGNLPEAMRFKIAQMLEEDLVGARLTKDVNRYAGLIQQAEERLTSETAERYIAQYRTHLEEAQKKVAERAMQLKEVLMQSESTQGGFSRLDLPREIEILKTQEGRLEEELKRQEAEGKKIGRSSIDVDLLVKEAEGLDAVVGGVTEELERTKIELKSNSRITVLGPARVPQLGESKRRLPVAAAAGLFGLCAPLMLLMGLDLRRQLVNGRQTMADLMIMPVLGSLPLIPKRIMQRIGDARRPNAVIWRRRLDESLAAVTSLLLRKLESEGHRVILIASATSGEGKSTLAAQLATSLAESGHSTLLIDFDLRRPTLHHKFNVPSAPGVTEVLRQGLELDRAVQTPDVPNLKILPAGGVSGGSLLQDSANGSLRALFVTARANFEIVVVDSAPLLPVVDGRMVGQHTDGAILSVIKDVSKVPQLMTTCSILEDYGIPALGCVVMGDSDDIYYSSYVKTGFEQLQST